MKRLVTFAALLLGLVAGTANAVTAYDGYGWLHRLSGSCWKSDLGNPALPAMEVCYWLDMEAGHLRVQRIDAGAPGGEVTLTPMAGAFGLIEERSYDAQCRVRPNVMRLDGEDRRAGPVLRYDDAVEAGQVVGFVVNGWRRIDADHFERSVRIERFGGEVSQSRWTFTRSRNYQVVGPSRCAALDRNPFPAELRPTASARP